MRTIKIRTSKTEEMVDVTGKVSASISPNFNGALLLYCPHTTASVLLNENADPTVKQDILFILSQLVPEGHPSYMHAEGNSHAHAKAVLTGNSVTVPVKDGKMLLGTWQGIFFAEYDGPRHRLLHVHEILRERT